MDGHKAVRKSSSRTHKRSLSGHSRESITEGPRVGAGAVARANHILIINYRK